MFRNLFFVLFVVIVLALMAAPVGAQESDPVMVALGNGVMVDEMVVIGVAFFLVAMLGLFGTQAVLLYRSTPPMIQGVIKMLADLVEKPVDRVIETTPSKADDELWDMFKDKLRAMLREELEAILLKEERVTVAESVKAMDEAIFGANSRAQGDGGDDGVLGDPVPMGG